MGLDTTHGAWHGPYSYFNQFRTQVAELAGFPPLDEMQGFGGLTGPPGTLQWGHTPGDHRLIPLLNHSDCDGEISPKDCLMVAQGLDAVLPKTQDSWLRTCIANFSRGCWLAHKENVPLRFG